MLYYVRTEEERLNKLHEEEAARKREEAERKKIEEAEKRAKQDETDKKQRQREQEVEEKPRLEKEAILRGTLIDRPSQILGPGITAPPLAPTPAPAAAAARSGTSAGRYVPSRLRRSEPAAQASALAPAPPAQSDRWTSSRKDDRGAPPRDKW